MNVTNRITHSCQQGSAEWLALRVGYFTASEAPAMLGVSKYQTRSDLLKTKATGVAPEIDAATQRLFDAGHAAEAAARGIAEGIIGQELFPVTITAEVEGLPLLASMDGLTLLGDIGWECKLSNAELRAAIESGALPEHYTAQMEQQLLVSGAERIYFTASDGTPEGTVGLWYESNPELRARIVAGWKQFVEDLKSYTPEPVQAAPVAKPVEGFGTLTLRVEGRVLASNLDTFKAGAEAFLARLPKPHELQTDQDFADAESAAKACAEAEDRIKAAKEQAIAQMADVDTVLRTADEVAAAIRAARLALDKAVKAEKENRRIQIVREAQASLSEHITKLQGRVGILVPVQADFAGAIKGLKSLASMRDKVATALANAKIEANAIADRIDTNRKAAGDDMSLFPDFAAVCTKDPDDFAALLSMRRQQRAEAEAKRLAAERERIATEEREKAEAKLRAEQEAAAQRQQAMLEAHQNRRLEEAAAQAEPTPAADARPTTPPTLRLGQINERLGFTVSVDFLTSLGFAPAATDKAARLYHESDFGRICSAIAQHVTAVGSQFAEKLAA